MRAYLNEVIHMTKEECDKDFSEGKLIMSDDKCKECEHYYSCIYMLMAWNDVVYGDDEYGELND